MVKANGVQKASECYVKRYFGGYKGAVLGIWQAWKNRRRGQVRRGVIIWGRELWVLVCWERDRGHPGGIMILCGCTTELYMRVYRGGCGHPPPDVNQAEGGEGRRRSKRDKKNLVHM